VRDMETVYVPFSKALGRSKQVNKENVELVKILSI
jgi:hypothetical protein